MYYSGDLYNTEYRHRRYNLHVLHVRLVERKAAVFRIGGS